MLTWWGDPVSYGYVNIYRFGWAEVDGQRTLLRGWKSANIFQGFVLMPSSDAVEATLFVAVINVLCHSVLSVLSHIHTTFLLPVQDNGLYEALPNKRPGPISRDKESGCISNQLCVAVIPRLKHASLLILYVKNRKAPLGHSLSLSVAMGLLWTRAFQWILWSLYLQPIQIVFSV